MDNDARHATAPLTSAERNATTTPRTPTQTQHTQVYAAVVRKMNASAALKFVFESGLAHGFRNYDVCDAAPCDRIIAQLSVVRTVARTCLSTAGAHHPIDQRPPRPVA